eukprot:gb/GEZJ01002450.1/.p1 GENE.gb/GEZJ01002450.1/~~gb/GEZJ01002450.1/.p1  ORF type:complete len:401 (-),score=36.19 gb/GEZJ01002450.1/:160-1362(-)
MPVVLGYCATCAVCGSAPLCFLHLGFTLWLYPLALRFGFTLWLCASALRFALYASALRFGFAFRLCASALRFGLDCDTDHVVDACFALLCSLGGTAHCLFQNTHTQIAHHLPSIIHFHFHFRTTEGAQRPAPPASRRRKRRFLPPAPARTRLARESSVCQGRGPSARAEPNALRARGADAPVAIDEVGLTRAAPRTDAAVAAAPPHDDGVLGESEADVARARRAGAGSDNEVVDNSVSDDTHDVVLGAVTGARSMLPRRAGECDGGVGVGVVHAVQKDGLRERSATGRVKCALGDGARAWNVTGSSGGLNVPAAAPPTAALPTAALLATSADDMCDVRGVGVEDWAAGSRRSATLMATEIARDACEGGDEGRRGRRRQGGGGVGGETRPEALRAHTHSHT